MLPINVTTTTTTTSNHQYPDSKVHGANMGPIWGRQDPGRPHVLCYLWTLLLTWFNFNPSMDK